MKYLIAGTGGVGGSIAGFLSLAGKDVPVLPVELICSRFKRTV